MSTIALRQPLFPEVGIVALVPESWDSPWQVRHHVLSRLAKFFRVVWVSPAAWFGRSHSSGAPTFRELDNGLTVYEPPRWLPRFGPVLLDTISERTRLGMVRRYLRKSGCRRIVLYVWRDEFLTSLRRVRHDATAYHIDDEYSFSPVEQPVSVRERRLLEEADLAIIHSPSLMEKKGAINRNTIMVPNGVSYNAFAGTRPEPIEYASIPRPRVGYVGYIKWQLNLELLLHLVKGSQRKASFVFVGPVGNLGDKRLLWEELVAQPNVYYLGEQSVERLPEFMQHLDVAVLPYIIDGYTKFIYPIKLHEYLAAGIPTIGTPIPALRGFSSCVRLEETSDGWSRAIDEIIAAHGERATTKLNCQAIAGRHDWDTLVAQIAKRIGLLLGAKYDPATGSIQSPPIDSSGDLARPSH